MSENDPFLLAEIQKQFDAESNSVNNCHAESQGFNEFEGAFLIPGASDNKDVLDNTETYISSYGPVISAGQPTDLNLALENNTLLNKPETIARNRYHEATIVEPKLKNCVRDKDPTDVQEANNKETGNTKQNGKTEPNKAKIGTPNEGESTQMIERESRAAFNKSLNEVSDIFIKIEEDASSSKETPGDEPSNKELARPSKFNCVMCDNHFMDLLQLESHVKSHNEVLHFSILLKKVGKENEERTRNVISSLIELARSSDINLNKFGSLFKNEGATRRKCNAAKQRRKSKPRKKELKQVEDLNDCDDVWNETIDDEKEDNERNDPTYAANQKDLEKNLTQGSGKRLRKRMKKEDESTNAGNAAADEQEVKDNDPETEKLEEKPPAECQEQWEAIAGSDFQIVKKDGPGRPAYGLNCPVCTKFITGRSKLRLHMKKEHGMFKSTAVRSGYKGNIKIHTCEVCGQKVKTLRRLKAHLLDKHKVTLSSNAKMYKCPLCDAFFGRRSELKEHRTEAHPGQSEHICTFCGKMLMSASLLEKHMRNHTGEKPYQCHLCPKAFTINTKLQEHIRQHTGERPFVCEICGAKFNRSCNKKRHMLIHEGKYPHTCEICGKGFRDIGPLTLHIRRHTGDKPYKCEDANCNMAFITRGELECHRAKHTQKREHLCSLCGAEFLYKGDLRRHAKLHTGERPYKCSDCNAAFTRNQHLKHHWQSHHASGARVHKEWKPRKKPEQFGLPKQSSLLTSQHQSSILARQTTSTFQQPSRFHQQQPTQPQQHVPQQHQQQQPNNTCVVCNQWFPSESALKSHGVIHTMDGDHMFLNMTTSCRQDYNPLSGVQLNNIPAPMPGALEVCTICNILITEPGTLQIHLQNVHGQYS